MNCCLNAALMLGLELFFCFSSVAVQLGINFRFKEANELTSFVEWDFISAYPSINGC